MARRWTAKAALARSRKNISGAIERLRAVAVEWGDMDEGVVSWVEDEIRALESLLETVEGSVSERIAEGAFE